MRTYEKNYDFRKKMLEVHQKDIRDFSVERNTDETELKNGLVLCVKDNADDVILCAARDFVDYLFVSMNISVRLQKGAPKENEQAIILELAEESGIVLDTANGYRGFRIECENNIRITGYDSRGAAQALYYMEDLMNMRKAPFIKNGVTEKRPLYSPQMVHSGYALDDFPNEHLSFIAHEGRDAIMIFAKDANMTPVGFVDFNALIYRAARYGIDVYAYSYLRSEKHPDDEGAEEYYESTYGKLFKTCPGLKGVILVGESVEFPSKDKSTSGKSYRIKSPDGIPDEKISPGWWPCNDYPVWLNMVKKIVRKYNENADIVFWTYNWEQQDESARLSLINSLPDDITLQVTFEKSELFTTDGVKMAVDDYSLSRHGYSDIFRSEAEAAKKKGMRLYSMTNTGGRTWDFGTCPYEPMPYQWIKRYKAMKEAHEKFGLSGIMECHHYGFSSSIISKLSKLVFLNPDEAPEEILFKLTESYYGKENAKAVDSAFKLWSEAITYYTPNNSDQYGAFRVGPSYPFCFDAIMNLNSAPYSHFGNSICKPYYAEITYINSYPAPVKLAPNIKSLEKMCGLLKQGIDVLENISDKNENLLELINTGKFLYSCSISGLNAKKWYKLKLKVRTEENIKKFPAIIDEMENLLRDEIKNAENAIEYVNKDSRLGWEPSMEYLTDEEHIRWKIKQVNYVINNELARVRTAISL